MMASTDDSAAVWVSQLVNQRGMDCEAGRDRALQKFLDHVQQFKKSTRQDVETNVSEGKELGRDAGKECKKVKRRISDTSNARKTAKNHRNKKRKKSSDLDEIHRLFEKTGDQSESEQQKFPCRFCPFVFHNSQDLDLHLTTHGINMTSNQESSGTQSQENQSLFGENKCSEKGDSLHNVQSSLTMMCPVCGTHIANPLVMCLHLNQSPSCALMITSSLSNPWMQAQNACTNDMSTMDVENQASIKKLTVNSQANHKALSPEKPSLQTSPITGMNQCTGIAGVVSSETEPKNQDVIILENEQDTLIVTEETTQIEREEFNINDLGENRSENSREETTQKTVDSPQSGSYMSDAYRSSIDQSDTGIVQPPICTDSDGSVPGTPNETNRKRKRKSKPNKVIVTVYDSDEDQHDIIETIYNLEDDGKREVDDLSNDQTGDILSERLNVQNMQRNDQTVDNVCVSTDHKDPNMPALGQNQPILPKTFEPQQATDEVDDTLMEKYCLDAALEGGGYKCKTCFEHFQTMTDFQQHKDLKLQCKYQYMLQNTPKVKPIKVVFERRSVSERYFPDESLYKGGYSCNTCLDDFQTLSEFQKHNLDLHNGCNYHCQRCPGKFQRKSALTLHVKVHTYDKVCNILDSVLNFR